MNVTPFLRTPLTDIFSTFNSYQSHRDCAAHEMRVVDCLEAYGVPRGREKCRLLTDDFRECVIKSKQVARYEIMKRERQRQFAAGERKEEFANDPISDSY